MEKVLITGGGGFLGSYVVKKYVERGDEVRVIGRRRYAELEKMGVKLFQGDIRDIMDLEKAAMGVDIIQHIAALPGIWGKKSDFFSINLNGTLNVISICRKLGIERLVYTSSPSVVHSKNSISGKSEKELDYPEKFNSFYPHSKALAEKEVLKANNDSIAGGKKLRTVSLRPHLIWGPGDKNLIPRLVEKARSGRLRIVGEGKNLVDIVYVENAADAQLIAGDGLKDRFEKIGGNSYFITQQEPVNLWEFINKILKIYNVPEINKRISFSSAYKIGFIFEKLYSLLKIYKEPPMTRFLAEQLAHDHYFNSTLAQIELGYKPEISTEDGLNLISVGGQV